MGKQGPCYHCGVTSTPLWRNGPPEKPVLCNACGSRWRTKGTLANYTPLHLRQESDYNLDNRVFKMKNILMNKKKDAKVLKRKHNHENGIAGDDVFYYNQGYRKNLDEDLSNRSSSGSAISYTESCAQLGNADASDLTGPVQSGGWETTVPLKKRTCVNQLQYSPVEKLTKDLYSILQEQQSSTLSESSEEDLLFESETPMVSVEIGHGSILIRHPSSIAREEESEASSLSVDNKQCHLSETNSHSAALPEHNDDMRVMLSSSKSDTIKDREGRRDNLQDENLEVLGHESSLCYIDLTDIVNFEEFVKILTSDEQQQLATYLPAVDTKTPESLRTLFDSPRFKEDLSSFHQLLAEGVLDISLSGVEMEDCNTLKRLALYNLNKSSWIEHYCLLKKCKNSTQGSHVVGASDVTAENKLVDFKSSLDIHNQNFSEAKAGPMNCKKWTMKSAYNKNEVIDSDSACVSPRSLFALPLDDPALSHFLRKNSDQELLLEVPSNDSFPQAELLQPTMGVGQ